MVRWGEKSLGHEQKVSKKFGIGGHHHKDLERWKKMMKKTT